MHLCPDCKKPCGCDGQPEYVEGYDECVHYLRDDCTGPIRRPESRDVAILTSEDTDFEVGGEG